MAKTDPINVANPAGDSDPKQGDDTIRALARAVAEILGVDHYIGSSSPYSEDAAGEHKKVTLNAVLGADPDPGTGKGAFYLKTVNAKPELFYEDADDNVIQLTSGGVLYSSAGLSIAGATLLTGKLDVTDSIVPTSYETTRGGFLDEDDLASDAGNKVASQQSIKAYIDSFESSRVKAWVKFSAAGAIRGDGFNVSNVTKTGTGDYTIQWDTNFADENYAVTGNIVSSSANRIVNFHTYTVGSVKVTIKSDSGTPADSDCSIIAIGDQD